MSAGARSRARRLLLAFALLSVLVTATFTPALVARNVALGLLTVALLVVSIVVIVLAELTVRARYRRAVHTSRTARETVRAHRKSLAVTDVLNELSGSTRPDATLDDLSRILDSMETAKARLDALAGLTLGDAWNPQRRAQVAANAQEIEAVLAEIRSLADWYELLAPLVYSGRFAELSAPLALPTASELVEDSKLDELARLPRHELVRRLAAGRPGREWLGIVRDFDSMGSEFAPVALALTTPSQRARLLDSARARLHDPGFGAAESDRWIVALAERISELPTAAGQQFRRNLARYLASTQTAIVRTSGREPQTRKPLALVLLRGSVEPNGQNRTPHGATYLTGVAPLKACA